MQKLWILSGRTSYYLMYPLLALYLRLHERTRVIVVCDGRVLLIKTWLYKDWWDLPGGGLHRGEDPAAGAARELAEETGIQAQISDLEYVYMKPFRSGLIRFNLHLFRYESRNVPDLRLQRLELVAGGWFTIDEVMKMKLHPSLKAEIGML
jgi:8-oxo-dGTP diphosphatase